MWLLLREKAEVKEEMGTCREVNAWALSKARCFSLLTLMLPRHSSGMHPVHRIRSESLPHLWHCPHLQDSLGSLCLHHLEMPFSGPLFIHQPLTAPLPLSPLPSPLPHSSLSSPPHRVTVCFVLDKTKKLYSPPHFPSPRNAG